MQRSRYLFAWSRLLIVALYALFTSAAMAAVDRKLPSSVASPMLLPTHSSRFAPTPALPSARVSRSTPALIADALLGPVGNIDPSQPVQLTLINDTPDALMVGESGPVQYQVAAGSNLQITLTAFPVNLSISPTPVNIATAYRVTIDDNTIAVQVLHLDSDAPGDRSLNIARDGTVSVY